MARPNDPVVGYMFSLDVNGISGYFTSVSGIGSEHSVATQKVVTQDGKEIEIKMPGRLTWGDITLKRGLTDDMKFWEWRDKVVHGKIEEARTNCSITMYNRDYTPVVTWNLFNAWPSKMTGITINSDSNDFIVEEMVISHEGLTREGADGMPAAPA